MSSPNRPRHPDDELIDELDPIPPERGEAGDDPAEPDEYSFDDFDEAAFGPGEIDEARRLGGGVTEMLRKAMVAGLGAVFMTEEGIRALVKDLKLPKDVMGFAVGQAERSKDELFRIVGVEMRRFFESAALRRELIKLLSEMTIEVKAEIRLRPESPEVKVSTSTARRRRKG
jgi:hypothetical protein